MVVRTALLGFLLVMGAAPQPQAAEFQFPRFDLGGLRRQAADPVPAVQGAPVHDPLAQAAPKAVTLTLANRTIGPGSGWDQFPQGMREALIEVALQPGANAALGDVTLEVAEIRDGEGYRPGNGELRREARDGSTWMYVPFTEPKTEKHPKTLRVVIVPKLNGRISGEPVVVDVKPVFALLTLFHSHGPRERPHAPQPADYELAWKYAKWKYDIDTAASTSIRYDPALTTMGATNPGAFNIGRNVRLGPTAFNSENIAASVLGHENTHAGQSLLTLLSSRAAEPPAYQWEIDNAARLETGDDYVAECRGFQRWYRGEGPRPD